MQVILVASSVHRACHRIVFAAIRRLQQTIDVVKAAVCAWHAAADNVAAHLSIATRDTGPRCSLLRRSRPLPRELRCHQHFPPPAWVFSRGILPPSSLGQLLVRGTNKLRCGGRLAKALGTAEKCPTSTVSSYATETSHVHTIPTVAVRHVAWQTAQGQASDEAMSPHALDASSASSDATSKFRRAQTASARAHCV